MKPVIETHDLCKSYNGRTVVDHLNLTVPQGCVYGFLGPNGAGKSTSMKMLLGLVHPTGGSVELLGHTMNETNRIPLLRQTGSLIESPSGYLHLTARENLAIVADLKGVAHKDIDRVLEIVHLTADANRKVGQYSLGMKQRLGIAMALLGSPKLLILDEPTNGLDPAGIQEMRSLISSMPETTGATVLISSHLLGEIEQMVTQVGILNHGRLLFEGSLQQLQKHSRGGILLRVLDVPKKHCGAEPTGHPGGDTGTAPGCAGTACPAGRSTGGTGEHTGRKRCRCGRADRPDKESGRDLPQPDPEQRGGGLRCCVPFMLNFRRRTGGTICCSACWCPSS